MALAVKSENTHAPPSGVAPDRSGVSMAGPAAGISGSLTWGSAFAVPVLLGGWNPVIVTLGRYLVYGLLSVILLTLGGRDLRRILREHWRAALFFAGTGMVEAVSARPAAGAWWVHADEAGQLVEDRVETIALAEPPGVDETLIAIEEFREARRSARG